LTNTPSNLVLALLSEFASDIRESRTIHQLALSSGKAYANTHAAATTLLSENILLKETVGHSHHCRLNLNNDKTLLYLSLLETVKRDEMLRKSPETRLLLSKIDANSAKLGILLAWKREQDILIVTTTHQTEASDIIGTPTTTIPLAAFLHDYTLRATISAKGTLLFGHALYASLLREVRR
jgi:hypothetical protein